MAWQRGQTRTNTPEWKALYRKARRELPLVCAVTGMTEAEAKAQGFRLELDHIIPDAEGGTDSLDNLQWLITPIHSAKSRKEWERGQKRRLARRRLPVAKHPGLV
ncbi:HNH endonuclease signature motif containing protein [Corynebacterium callunae]|uniref:HNH endonuclease signature motif containing protein n=1 Tax=Corynebacterium callunae TaxID=1721 RepID=UPI003982710E